MAKVNKIIIAIGILILVLSAVVYFLPGAQKMVRDTSLLKGETPAAGVESSVSDSLKGTPPRSMREPDIEQIKRDLIGQSIPGWNFDSLSEIRKAEISSIARTSESVEFRVDLTLVPYNNPGQSPFLARVISTYLAGDDGWYLHRIEEMYISFDLKIPKGETAKVVALPECKLLPDDKNKLFWSSSTWEYEIISGPGFSGMELPEAAVYEVKSAGGKAVTTRLTFRPNKAPD